MRGGRSASVVWGALVTVALTSCGVPAWDVAHRTLVELGNATNVVDRVVRARMPASYDDAERFVVEQVVADVEAYRACVQRVAEGEDVTCERPRTAAEYMAEWGELVGPWRAAIEALDAARDALVVAEHAIIVWRALREEPGNWGEICGLLGTTQERLTHALTACEVDVPVAWETMRPLLAPVCEWAVEVIR
jgi:hypothetical protein